MSLNEDLNITGRLTIRRYTAAGALVEELKAPNQITLRGRELVAKLFNYDRADKKEKISRISKIRVGTGGREFKAQDNELQAPLGETPIVKIEELTVPDSKTPRMMLRLTGELGEKDCNGELREAGLFTEKDEVMYNRVVFPPVNKSEEFKLTLVWELTF